MYDRRPESIMRLGGAILFYGGDGTIATYNDVEDGVIQTPGKLISREDIENAVSPMEDGRVNPYDEVNKYALYTASNAIIWWSPSLKRTYICGKERSMYEWPSMVFVRTAKSLHAYGYPGNEPPREDTMLYHPAPQPAWGRDGRVHTCGLNLPPPRMSVLQDIEDAFFFSPFTEMPSPIMPSICTLGDIIK